MQWIYFNCKLQLIMNILDKRKENHRKILEGRFIRKVLFEQSEEILEQQEWRMLKSNFRTRDFYNHRTFDVKDSSTELKFLMTHRFVDISTRRTKTGEVRPKKSHPIYNRIIFGHLSNIVREISFGFTDAVIEEMKKLEN